ncbi:hypothetical protein CCHR01_18829 [Colletotrichum chrysophilum]|uniref:Uncharacterized protein n=1 Tax=Colletotrichum chrysophilum TaxID=1836956 RepID=A0AAD9E8I3_9PEZI|nr:hypothetical protein CCHR01_18829 [Colletotrichum chrysophilum]
MASHSGAIELNQRYTRLEDATPSDGEFSPSIISYDPIEPAPVRRRPLPASSRTTLEEPLLLEQSPDPRTSINFDFENSQHRFSDSILKDDYITSAHPYRSPRLDSVGKQIEHNPNLNPKPITRTNLSRYLNGWLVHIPALASTAVIIWISWEDWYWFPMEGPWPELGFTADVMNNILQLPAKIHELLIVASLSSIAIAMLRRLLVGGGVRLGFLTGGYRVGDILYLTSKPFRHSRDLKNPVSWEAIIALFLIFATLMSTVVGPASAVLLVPTPGWFPMAHSLAFRNLSDRSLPVFYDSTPGAVWPHTFNETPNIAECKTIDGIYEAWCPAGGYSEIWNWAESYGATDLKNNLTFQFPTTDVRRHLVHTESGGEHNTVLSTTPSNFFMIGLGLVQKYIDGYNVGLIHTSSRYELTPRLVDYNASNVRALDKPIYQPMVQSKCRVYKKQDFPRPDPRLTYPTEAMECFGDEDCKKIRDSPPVFDADFLFNVNNRSQTISTEYTTKDKTVSPVVLIAGQVPFEKDHTKDIAYTCSLLATWVPSNFSLDPAVSDVLYSSLSNEEQLRSVHNHTLAEEVRIIRFNHAWFPYLNPIYEMTNAGGITFKTSAVLRIIDLFSGLGSSASSSKAWPIYDREPADAELYLSKVFGVYLTEALARTGMTRSMMMILDGDNQTMQAIDLNTQYTNSDGRFEVELFNSNQTRWNFGKGPELRDYTLNDLYHKVLPGLLNFDFDVKRYGYGTGHQRKTVTFARVMMYIYLATVVLYAFTVGFAHAVELTGRGRRLRVLSVVPWADLQDLVVLALKTPPPRDDGLADAGAGVSSPTVWKKTVKARADEQHNVRLVLNDEPGMERLDVTGKEKYF